MSRALLAFVLAFSLGSPAVQPWAEALLQLMHVLPLPGESSTQAAEDDPDGAEPDAGNHWDPNG